MLYIKHCVSVYIQVVHGVISQDSDVFLYGGNTVFRNFTANQKKVTAEKFKYVMSEKSVFLNKSFLG